MTAVGNAEEGWANPEAAAARSGISLWRIKTAELRVHCFGRIVNKINSLEVVFFSALNDCGQRNRCQLVCQLSCGLRSFPWKRLNRRTMLCDIAVSTC